MAGLQHFASPLKASRAICIPSFVMRFTGLLPKRCGTHFVTPRRGRSRLKSAMTMNNSDCACGMMVKVLIQRFCRGRGARGTMACPACGNAPMPLAASCRCGAKLAPAPKWNCAFLPLPPTRQLGEVPGFHGLSPGTGASSNRSSSTANLPLIAEAPTEPFAPESRVPGGLPSTRKCR